MRAAQFLAIIGRGSKGSNALENTEDRAGATSEQQDNVINTVNSLDPYGPSWQLVPGNVAAGTVYAQVPTSGTGDLTFTRASTATRTDSAGTIVNVATGVPRIDYRNSDGSLSSTGRLLLESQRTNSIRNSTMVGAVAGTPGTIPTNWGNVGVSGGLSRDVVGVGISNGLPYVDLRYYGTASSGVVIIAPDSFFSNTTSAGQVWTTSFWLSYIGSGRPDRTDIAIDWRSGSPSVIFSTISPTSSLARFSFGGTATTGTTTSMGYVQFSLTIGATYDFTIRIAAPQMELGAYATTFIPTTTAAVTRVADAASKTGVSSLIGQTEGTLYMEFNVPFNNRDIDLINIDAGSSANGFYVTARNSFVVQLIVRQNSTNALIFQRAGAYSVGLNKIAVAYKNGDFAISLNGTAAQINTSTITMPTGPISRIKIAEGAYSFDQPLQVGGAALFPTRLTNAQLAQLTTL